MQNISLAQKVDFQKGELKNQEIVTVEPLYPGYGITIGNSIRRILLSSLSGAAVIGVKIKGVNHEFMGLKNIKEDALEMILNLKQLRLKIHSDEEVKLTLSVKGKKEVKASDIEKNADIEIVNPDLVIANITDKTGELEMEIFVKKGMGYKLADTDKKKNSELGYIEIDSVFSPVISTSINVENVRVGQMTDWDKLSLIIQTDGSVSVKDVFDASIKILVDQFNALIGIKEEVIEGEKVEEPKEEIKEDEKEDKKEEK